MIRRIVMGMAVLALAAGCVSKQEEERAQTLTLVHMCDPQLGFGLDGFDADVARFEQAVNQVNALAPDAVVIAGDMVNAMTPEAIAAFRGTAAKIRSRLILSPGNHDLLEPVTPEGLKLYRDTFGDDFQTREIKDFLIVSANSQMWREAPPVETELHNWRLGDALVTAHTRGIPVIVVTHVPPFISDVDEPDEYFNLPEKIRRPLLDFSAANGAFLWLSGHIHKAAERSYGTIAILNGESTSNNFDGRPYGFRVLTVRPDRSWDWVFHPLEE